MAWHGMAISGSLEVYASVDARRGAKNLNRARKLTEASTQTCCTCHSSELCAWRYEASSHERRPREQWKCFTQEEAKGAVELCDHHI